MLRALATLMVVVLPAVTMAQAPLKLASTEAESKRFFPLDAARQASSEKQKGITITREKKPLPLRNDQQQRDAGFLRIDRALSVPVPSQRTLPTGDYGVNRADSSATAKEKPIAATAEANAAEGTVDDSTESEEIVGNREAINPVLALFDGAQSETLGSFSDVMRGKKSVSAEGRHPFWPIPLNASQYVSSGFGMRTDPFHGRQAFHGGIDIAAATGTPVLATADATVSKVTSDPRYGNYVALSHADGTITRYGHLSAQTVREGERVRGGQTIGAVGSTGRSTGAHLDYRVSKNNTKFDPLSILSLPSTVAYKAPRSAQPLASAVNVVRGNSSSAMNPLPKRPMVIRVQ